MSPNVVAHGLGFRGPVFEKEVNKTFSKSSSEIAAIFNNYPATSELISFSTHFPPVSMAMLMTSE